MQYRRHRSNETRYYVIYMICTSILFVLILIIALLFMGIIQILQTGNARTNVQIQPAVKSIESEPIQNITYENTWMYEEELKQKKAEEEERKRQENILYLQKVIFAEAQGESLKGKILVGASVVNRVKHDDFPNTIKEVIEQRAQYAKISWISEKFIKSMKSWQKDSWEDCRVAAERALKGEDPAEDFLGGPTLYFYNPEKSDADELKKRENIKVYVEDNHFFHYEAPQETQN